MDAQKHRGRFRKNSENYYWLLHNSSPNSVNPSPLSPAIIYQIIHRTKNNKINSIYIDYISIKREVFNHKYESTIISTSFRRSVLKDFLLLTKLIQTHCRTQKVSLLPYIHNAHILFKTVYTHSAYAYNSYFSLC